MARSGNTPHSETGNYNLFVKLYETEFKFPPDNSASSSAQAPAMMSSSLSLFDNSSRKQIPSTGISTSVPELTYLLGMLAIALWGAFSQNQKKKGFSKTAVPQSVNS